MKKLIFVLVFSFVALTLSAQITSLTPNTVGAKTILPNGTRLYNLGSSGAYWLNTYSQNAYIDTIKTSKD